MAALVLDATPYAVARSYTTMLDATVPADSTRDEGLEAGWGYAAGAAGAPPDDLAGPMQAGALHRPARRHDPSPHPHYPSLTRAFHRTGSATGV
ncbi:MAG TPA: hypothetical protein VK887_07540 [Pseudonocardiaceae bacterium]|nr:hypothetical protein [Pseudonocardiaceae bacterium]